MNIFSWLFKKKNEKSVLAFYPEAVIVVSFSGEILYANDNLLKLLNISSDELFDLELLDIFDGGFNLVNNLSKCNDSAVVRSKLQADEELYFEIKASTYEDDEEKIIISIRNVTNTQKMLTKLLFEHEYTNKLNKNKNTFLTKISSEILSPIHSINGFSQAILEGLGGDVSVKQEKYLKIINKNANQLLELLEGYLEYSKLESGIYDYEFKSFDFVNSLTSLFNKYKEQADEKKIILNFDLNGLMKRNIYSDEAILKRVLETLLEEAILRTDTGSIQLIITHPEKEYLEYAGINANSNFMDKPYMLIQIIDTGYGITASELDNYFDPYANIDKYLSKKTVPKSLNMGIMYNLVRLLKGKIWIDTEQEKGCSFNILIPVEKITL